jgi:glycosyltransferase involved in cell wall biosynthesis
MPKKFVSINLVFTWSDISGYMAACWRKLHQQPNINLTVIAFQAHTAIAFNDEIMHGIPSRLLDFDERYNYQLIKQLVLATNPDIIVLCGWLHHPYRCLASDSDLSHVKFVMAMDTPWQGTFKQYLAPFALRSYLSRINRVVVSGERSWHYARHLGIPPNRIQKGLYGIDFSTWAILYTARTQNLWPRRFLFVGRYVFDKAIDVLVDAYQQYRTQVSNPWTLLCCGKGEMESLLESQPGIENQGFVQPSDMPEIWTSAGAFVLPSRFDPWPLALVEAAAAGLPVVCTDACGSAVEVVRSGYNGQVVPPDDANSLAKALLAIDRAYAHLPSWGIRSQQLAAPYAAENWAERWYQLCHDLISVSLT